jgi:hypothetical protein
MARTVATNFTSTLQFPKATAATDLFKKEDVQTLAEAVDQHDHSSGKGVVVNVTGIAAGAINGSQITDNTITSAKITDGTIATADLANAAVTNVKLGTDTARANLLTNGGFEVWQRGNGPFTTAYTADRWGWSPTGSDTVSISRDTANADTGSQACAAVAFTKGSGTTSSLYNYDNDLAPQLAGRTVSFSIRVKTSTANAVRIRTYDGTTIGSGTYHSGGGAYQTLTLTTTISAAPTVAWFGVEFDASCTAYLDNAMLVVGSQAADYAPLHPADDLARCLRYYELLSSSVGDFSISGYGAAGAVCATALAYKARKAVNPTITKNATWPVSNCGQPVATAAGVDFLSVGVSVTALGSYSFTNNTGGANFSAESNP